MDLNVFEPVMCVLWGGGGALWAAQQAPRMMKQEHEQGRSKGMSKGISKELLKIPTLRNSTYSSMPVQQVLISDKPASTPASWPSGRPANQAAGETLRLSS